MPWRDGITTISMSSKKGEGFVDVSHTIHELFYRHGSDPETGAMVLLEGYILSSNDSIPTDHNMRITINDVDVVRCKLRPVEQEGYQTGHKYEIYGWTRKPYADGDLYMTDTWNSVERLFTYFFGVISQPEDVDNRTGTPWPNLQTVEVDTTDGWVQDGKQTRIMADWFCCLWIDGAHTSSEPQLLFPPKGSFSGFHWVDAVTELNLIDYTVDFGTEHIRTSRSLTVSRRFSPTEYTVNAGSGISDIIGGDRSLDLPFRVETSKTATKNRIGHMFDHGAKPRTIVTLHMSSDVNAAWKEDISKLCYAGQKIRIKLPRHGTTSKNYDLWVVHVERHMHWDRADKIEVKLVSFD